MTRRSGTSRLTYKHGKIVRQRLRSDPAYRIVMLCRELDMEMDGVSEIPASAAAILNGIRAALSELPDDYLPPL